MLIRREARADADVIRAVTAAAFAKPGDPGALPAEAALVDELRAGPAWLPPLSMVAEGPAGEVVGHVTCTRGHVGDAQAHLGEAAVLGLGPLSVDPAHQGRGVGSALVHAVLGAADALGEPLVVLLGDPGYYRRFGFVAARTRAIAPPVAEWEPYFQVRTLAAYQPSLMGTFRYAEPFDRV